MLMGVPLKKIMKVFYSFLCALINVRPPFDPLIKRLLKIGKPNFLAINVFIFDFG